MRVEEVMTRDVVTVTPETSLKDVGRKLVELRVRSDIACSEG